MKSSALIWSCVSLALVSSGCINLKDAPSARKEAKVPVLQTWAQQAQADQGQVQDNWVQSFNDPVLDTLVREALKNNYDLQLAAARRDEAIAFARRVGADFWPTADAQGGASWGAGTQRDSHALRGVVNWELDLWGRVRYLSRSAEANLRAAQADLEFARQSIAAQVAEAYYLAVANRLRLENSQAFLTMEEEIDRIEQAKLRQGQTDKFTSELSRSDLARFRADVQNYMAAQESSLRSLEVLLGRFPAAEVKGAAELPVIDAPIPAGIPASLLARRPDIRSAQEIVETAFYRTESVRTELLPRIALTAQGGWASDSLGSLLNENSLGSSMGANLTQPLFDAGARFANIDVAKAQQQQAIANYGTVALRAFREVQEGLANINYYGSQTYQLRLSDESVQTALPLAEKKYRSGDLTLLNLKQVQTQAYQTRDAFVVSEYALLQQRIQLHRALGGSIVAPPATQPATGPAAAPVSATKQPTAVATVRQH